MPTPVPTYLKNHEAVVAAFGEWPGFHDAPVLAVRYSERQGGRVEIDLHGFWVTGEVGEGGYLKLTSHHLVRFAFTGITDADLTGSTNGNVLFDLGFSSPEEFDAAGKFTVCLESAMGGDRSGFFTARSGEVLKVSPCAPRLGMGRPF